MYDPLSKQQNSQMELSEFSDPKKCDIFFLKYSSETLAHARYGGIKIGWKKIQRNIGHFQVLVEYTSYKKKYTSYKRKKIYRPVFQLNIRMFKCSWFVKSEIQHHHIWLIELEFLFPFRNTLYKLNFNHRFRFYENCQFLKSLILLYKLTISIKSEPMIEI